MKMGLSAVWWALMTACLPAQATVFELPTDGSAVFGTDETIKSTYQDTLLDIARRYSLGYEEIIRANPKVDMWLPGEGTEILLPGRRILPPGPREGIVVNLPEHRLYYYPKPRKGEKPVVITYPVSIGKMDWRSPLGQTQIVAKEKHPNWYPPESVRKEHAANGDPLPKVVPPGPDNPLGDFKMRLAVGDGAYLIHGTNNPMAVGMAITHGCIRMYPEDVAALFPLVPVGTKVWLINDPVKVAYVEGELLLEAHPPVDAEGQTVAPNLDLLSQLLDKALGSSTAAIHWDLARETLQAADGMPAVVGLQADLDEPMPASTPPGVAPTAAGQSMGAVPASTGGQVSDVHPSTAGQSPAVSPSTTDAAPSVPPPAPAGDTALAGTPAAAGSVAPAQVGSAQPTRVDADAAPPSQSPTPAPPGTIAPLRSSTGIAASETPDSPAPPTRPTSVASAPATPPNR
jgi:L,D-transpeptidase ErfK/SrfK